MESSTSGTVVAMFIANKSGRARPENHNHNPMIMKKSVLTLLLAAICAAPSPAEASTDSYLSISGGMTMMGDSDLSGTLSGFSYTLQDAVKYEPGYAINVAYGLRKNDFRLELAAGYQANDVDKIGSIEANGVIKGDGDILSVMYNGYYDMDMENVLPYVTLGIGYANVGVNYSEPGYELDSNNSAFAYQLGAGIGIPVNDNVTIDIGYRYFATTDIEIQPGIELSIGSHNILAGFRHTF